MLSRKNFLIVVGVLLVLRLLIIFNLGFIDDEAYHWSWSRNMDLSYFDHPGMVAWLIWPWTKIFGNVEWAIRMPAMMVFVSILFVVYKLGKDMFDEKTAQLAALMVFFIPLWGIASLGTLPDVPLGLFWIIQVWVFWQSIRTDGRAWTPMKTWLWIGVVMGLGMNSKMTCCLLGLGMILFLLCTPRLRWHLRTPWPYLGALVTLVMMTPVFWWNYQHQWASFNYQFVSRHQEAHGVDFNRWLQFCSYQLLFMSPAVYFLMITALIVGLRRLRDDRWRFIALLPLPALCLFYYQPLMAAYKPHWSGPAYMILLIGATRLFLEGVPHFFKAKSKVIIGISVLFLLPIQLLYIPMFTPVIPKVYAKFAADPKQWNPTWDFTNEFYGWRELGAHLYELQENYQHTTGRRPLIAGQRYEIVAQLTWGTQERVWQLCPDRDHYLFNQTPAEMTALVGQDFLVITSDKYPRDPMAAANFDSCEKSQWPFYRGDTLARVFDIYYCKGFHSIK